MFNSLFNYKIGKNNTNAKNYELNLEKHSFIVVTYEIRVFFEGAQKEVFSSI
jgi:hypothetical protein